MRVTSLLRKILGLKKTRIHGVQFISEGLVIDVKPTWTVSRCSGCRQKVHGGYDCRQRLWRHLDLGGMQTFLRYTIGRVNCPQCGIVVEDVPWAVPLSRFTLPFENEVAFLAQRCDKKTVSIKMRIAWETVGRIVDRIVKRKGPTRADRIKGLRIIGVDELSYRKNHKYLTIVTNHLTGKVVWVAEGKNSQTLGAFFAELGPQGRAKIQAVTMDMSAAYIKAVTQAVPHAELIFDRFHVQRLLHDAVDEVRRDLVREQDNAEDGKSIKGTRWALLKSPWNLTELEEKKLSELKRSNEPLYRAYLLKEAFLAVLDRRQPGVAKRKLGEWLDWAARSRLDPFIRVGKTIRKHMDGIIEYVRTGLNNGLSEGINRKLRTITARSYGFQTPQNFIAMIHLCCGGIDLMPSHIRPSEVH